MPYAQCMAQCCITFVARAVLSLADRLNIAALGTAFGGGGSQNETGRIGSDDRVTGSAGSSSSAISLSVGSTRPSSLELASGEPTAELGTLAILFPL